MPHFQNAPQRPGRRGSAGASRAAAPDFNEAWQEWLAQELLRGTNRNRVTAALARNGFTKGLAQRKIEETLGIPAFRASEKVLQGSKQVRSLLNAFGEQLRQSGALDRVPRVASLTASDFYRQYYFVNRPVILTGLMKGWRALRLWGPDYFAREFGNCAVEIMSGRSSDAHYDRNAEAHRRRITMKNYVRMVKEGGETNDYYLVARNFLLKRREFKVLLSHLKCPKGFLDAATFSNTRLWFGPKGTVTPLHHDPCNSMLGQIYGRKRIKLIPPFDLENLYCESDCFSAVDLGSIDYDRFPRMRRVSILDVVIEPGEFLFTPLGWWHWVQSLDISISVSCVNFCPRGTPVVWNDEE